MIALENEGGTNISQCSDLGSNFERNFQAFSTTGAQKKIKLQSYKRIILFMIF